MHHLKLRAIKIPSHIMTRWAYKLKPLLLLIVLNCFDQIDQVMRESSFRPLILYMESLGGCVTGAQLGKFERGRRYICNERKEEG